MNYSSISASAKSSTSSKAFHVLLIKLLELQGYKETDLTKETKTEENNFDEENNEEDEKDELFGMGKCQIKQVFNKTNFFFQK